MAYEGSTDYWAQTVDFLQSVFLPIFRWSGTTKLLNTDPFRVTLIGKHCRFLRHFFVNDFHLCIFITPFPFLINYSFYFNYRTKLKVLLYHVSSSESCHLFHFSSLLTNVTIAHCPGTGPRCTVQRRWCFWMNSRRFWTSSSRQSSKRLVWFGSISVADPDDFCPDPTERTGSGSWSVSLKKKSFILNNLKLFIQNLFC